MRAALLILAGAVTSASYRFLSPARSDPFVQVVSFSMPSVYNTSTEYRYYDHGHLLALDKSLYHQTLPFAIIALVIQATFWFPALVILFHLGIAKSQLNIAGLSVLIAGVVLWLISVVTGLQEMKTVELSIWQAVPKSAPSTSLCEPSI